MSIYQLCFIDGLLDILGIVASVLFEHCKVWAHFLRAVATHLILGWSPLPLVPSLQRVLLKLNSSFLSSFCKSLFFYNDISHLTWSPALFRGFPPYPCSSHQSLGKVGCEHLATTFWSNPHGHSEAIKLLLPPAIFIAWSVKNKSSLNDVFFPSFYHYIPVVSSLTHIPLTTGHLMISYSLQSKDQAWNSMPFSNRTKRLNSCNCAVYIFFFLRVVIFLQTLFQKAVRDYPSVGFYLGSRFRRRSWVGGALEPHPCLKQSNSILLFMIPHIFFFFK